MVCSLASCMSPWIAFTAACKSHVLILNQLIHIGVVVLAMSSSWITDSGMPICVSKSTKRHVLNLPRLSNTQKTSEPRSHKIRRRCSHRLVNENGVQSAPMQPELLLPVQEDRDWAPNSASAACPDCGSPKPRFLHRAAGGVSASIA